MISTTDEEILSLFREQSTKNKGFTLLMNKFNERIYWHIRRLVVSHDDAQDILQETFINVYKGLDSFSGNSKLYTWVYRIATNECLRLLRNRKKFRVSQDGVNEKLINQLQESSTIDAAQILVKFQEAILLLPEKQQLVFNMRYYDELSYEEISQILDSSVATLKTNYHYANSRIKEYMLKNS